MSSAELLKKNESAVIIIAGLTFRGYIHIWLPEVSTSKYSIKIPVLVFFLRVLMRFSLSARRE